MSDAIIAETTTIRGHNGEEIEAYFARPVDGDAQPSVVVIHHMPGYDRASKEIVRTFAVYGYAALMPNLFHSYAPGAKAAPPAMAVSYVLPKHLTPATNDAAAIEKHRESLADAERSFSRDAQTMGIGEAFKKYGSPDAINLGGPMCRHS